MCIDLQDCSFTLFGTHLIVRDKFVYQNITTATKNFSVHMKFNNSCCLETINPLDFFFGFLIFVFFFFTSFATLEKDVVCISFLVNVTNFGNTRG